MNILDGLPQREPPQPAPSTLSLLPAPDISEPLPESPRPCPGEGLQDPPGMDKASFLGLSAGATQEKEAFFLELEGV